jgi:hypothetical protein
MKPGNGKDILTALYCLGLKERKWRMGSNCWTYSSKLLLVAEELKMCVLWGPEGIALSYVKLRHLCEVYRFILKLHADFKFYFMIHFCVCQNKVLNYLSLYKIQCFGRLIMPVL